MDELKSLENRLSTITQKLEQLLADREDSQHDDQSDSSLKQENARLRAELKNMKQQRKLDMADLDKLMQQLRPLMEEEDA